MGLNIRKNASFILFFLGAFSLFGFVYSFFDEGVSFDNGILMLIPGIFFTVASVLLGRDTQ